MRHMATYLGELSSKNDLKSVAQQPDIILLVRMGWETYLILLLFLFLKNNNCF
jgi:hypothetical protein